MADVLPVNFPVPSESSITSYDYVDIIDGLGYSLFYGFYSFDGAMAGKFKLSGNATASDTLGTLYPVGTNNYAFDSSIFNAPRTIQGTMILRYTVQGTNAGSNLDLTPSLSKVSGGAETVIVTATSPYQTTGTTTKNCNINMTIPKTLLKKGDFLRLNMSGTSSGNTSYIMHDPINRSSTTPSINSGDYPTKLEVLIPFKLEL